MPAAVLSLVVLALWSLGSVRGVTAQAGWPQPPSQSKDAQGLGAQTPAPAPTPDAAAAPAPSEPAAPAQPAPAQPAPPAATPPAGPPPPPVYTQSPPPPPVYERLGKPEVEVEKGDWDPWEHASPDQHNHDGFYLRLAIGFGGGSVWGNDHRLAGVKDVTLSGLGFGTSIAIGGTIAENLSLNADLFQTMLFNPMVRQDGKRVGRADDLNRDLGVGQNLQLAGFGIGLTYYIMPANIYLAGSVGLGQAIFEDAPGARSGSDFGFAANFMLGKEWWVSPDWGIGVAGQFTLLATEDPILGGLHGGVFNLMFSATYN